MASYSAAVAAHETLVANTVDTITFSGECRMFQVTNRSGVADIYFTFALGTAPSAPTVGGLNTFVAPGAAGSTKQIEFMGDLAIGLQVSLISSGTPTYSVEILR